MDGILTRLILKYRKTGFFKERCIQLASLEVFRFAQGRIRWTEDQRSEFVTFFYPLLEQLIENFAFRDKPFEAYLWTTLKYRARTFIDKVYKRIQLENVFMDIEKIEENYMRNDAEPFQNISFSALGRRLFQTNAAGGLVSSSQVKKLLILSLKNALYLTDAQIEFISEVTGTESGKLFSMIQHIRTDLQECKNRTKILREKRNRHYVRILSCERRLADIDDEGEKSRLVYKLKREKNGLMSTVNQMKQIRNAPTHKDIAHLLNIPKGSIDSGIFYLRRALNDYSEPG